VNLTGRYRLNRVNKSFGTFLAKPNEVIGINSENANPICKERANWQTLALGTLPACAVLGASGLAWLLHGDYIREL